MHVTEADKKYLLILSQDTNLVLDIQSKLPRDLQLEIYTTDLYSLKGCVSEQARRVIVVDVAENPMAYPPKTVEQLLMVGAVGPVIAIGGDVPGSTVAQWAKLGLVDYLDRPIDPSQLCRSLEEAMCVSSTLRNLRNEYGDLVERTNSITEGEREVMELVLQGVPNKSIANRLSVSQRTVESRRQKVYRKMQSAHLAELVRTIDRMHWLRFELSHPNVRFLTATHNEDKTNLVSPI